MARKMMKVAAFAVANEYTEPQVRWWVFNEKTNGMDGFGVVKRIGRRVYIDPEAFDRWVDAQQTQQVAA